MSLSIYINMHRAQGSMYAVILAYTYSRLNSSLIAIITALYIFI